MPEIGATLREARMRARIDISEIEAETKIRAKYLRALENEEWGLLPGPAYVRSFLRTYAEALDLDAKLLLEEYKLRHERPSDHDLMPIGAPRRRRGGGLGGPAGMRGRPPRGVHPLVIAVVVVVVGLLAALYALGKTANDDNNGTSASTTQTSRTTTTPVPRRTSTTATKKKSSTTTRRRSTAASSRFARLQIVPTGQSPVYVCLGAAGGRLPLNGVTLQPGSTSGTYRSSKFRLRLGNGNVSLRVNGKLRRVGTGSPLGYVITRKSMRRVDPRQTPSCGR
jgi:cytoskeletal protein RodZ